MSRRKQPVSLGEGCPWPGCGLPEDHDGEHVPRLRLVQRYTFPDGMFPGFCEWHGIPAARPRRAAGLYATVDNHAIELCDRCAAERKAQRLLTGAA